MPSYLYLGQRVDIPRYADIPNEFRPDGRWAQLVQEVLDNVEGWENGDDPIETERHNNWPLIFPMAVQVGANERLTWGIHAGHKARTPGLSPFVQKFVPAAQCKSITIELTGTPTKPALVRAYGGEYTPPLPWMGSAQSADGGREACLEYWQNHAYRTHFGDRIIVPSSQTAIAPHWYIAR